MDKNQWKLSKQEIRSNISIEPKINNWKISQKNATRIYVNHSNQQKWINNALELWICDLKLLTISINKNNSNTLSWKRSNGVLAFIGTLNTLIDNEWSCKLEEELLQPCKWRRRYCRQRKSSYSGGGEPTSCCKRRRDSLRANNSDTMTPLRMKIESRNNEWERRLRFALQLSIRFRFLTLFTLLSTDLLPIGLDTSFISIGLYIHLTIRN